MITTFLLFLVIMRKKIDLHLGMLVFLCGLVGIFYLNVLRIYLLMVIGTFNPEFALNAFHNNSGWILFLIYFCAIVFYTIKAIQKR